MGWHLDSLPILACQDIVASIALVIDVFGSHQGAHSAILIVLLQILTIVRLVVV